MKWVSSTVSALFCASLLVLCLAQPSKACPPAASVECINGPVELSQSTTVSFATARPIAFAARVVAAPFVVAARVVAAPVRVVANASVRVATAPVRVAVTGTPVGYYRSSPTYVRSYAAGPYTAWGRPVVYSSVRPGTVASYSSSAPPPATHIHIHK